jgi:hypothetical protein
MYHHLLVKENKKKEKDKVISLEVLVEIEAKIYSLLLNLFIRILILSMIKTKLIH